MFPYYYALEKLANAVRILAIGEGDVRSRLLPAFEEFSTLKTEDFPPDLQADYDWIMKELTKRQPRDWLERSIWGYAERNEWVADGAVQFNLRRMINRTGSRIAGKICDLEYHVRLAYEEWKQYLGEQPK